MRWLSRTQFILNTGKKNLLKSKHWIQRIRYEKIFHLKISNLCWYCFDIPYVSKIVNIQTFNTYCEIKGWRIHKKSVFKRKTRIFFLCFCSTHNRFWCVKIISWKTYCWIVFLKIIRKLELSDYIQSNKNFWIILIFSLF